MKPRHLFPAILLALVASLAIAQDAPPTSLIEGPVTVAPYKLLEHKIPAGWESAIWEIRPGEAADVRTDPTGNAITWVAPPGAYQVEVILVNFSNKKIQKAIKGVVIGEGPSPNPLPPPVPSPPPGAKQLVIFFDRAQLDNLPPGQQAILASLALREQVDKVGHNLLGIVDPKATSGSVPPAVAYFSQSIKDHKLPCVGIAPIKGGTITFHDLPPDEASFLKLLGG